MCIAVVTKCSISKFEFMVVFFIELIFALSIFIDKALLLFEIILDLRNQVIVIDEQTSLDKGIGQ